MNGEVANGAIQGAGEAIKALVEELPIAAFVILGFIVILLFFWASLHHISKAYDTSKSLLQKTYETAHEMIKDTRMVSSKPDQDVLGNDKKKGK